MERIALLTDSTCDLPAELLAERNIVMVPLSVLFGDDEYRDNVDLKSDEFYRKLKSAEELPTTSQPSPGKFLAAFQKLQQEGYTHILCLLITSTFSSTQQSAAVAAKMASGVTIQIVDSRTTSWGLGLLVLYADGLIRSGATFAEVTERVREKLGKITVYFTVETLDALQRGGRIGRAAALVGKLLDMRPILELGDGSGVIEAIKKVRTHKAVVTALTELTSRHIQTRGLEFGVCLIRTADPAPVSEMLGTLQATGLDLKQVFQGTIGPVIGTHLGPDGWGIVLF